MSFVLLSFNVFTTYTVNAPQAISEETIKKLKEENDMHIEKEVISYLRYIFPLF